MVGCPPPGMGRGPAQGSGAAVGPIELRGRNELALLSPPMQPGSRKPRGGRGLRGVHMSARQPGRAGPDHSPPVHHGQPGLHLTPVPPATCRSTGKRNHTDLLTAGPRLHLGSLLFKIAARLLTPKSLLFQ